MTNQSNMEIERKFVIDEKNLPDLGEFQCKKLVQGYLNTAPVVRIRREGEEYFLTYKGGGLMARTEYNLPLDRESFDHMLPKCDGNIISKTRYFIPLADEKRQDRVVHTLELDVFDAPFAGLIVGEVEFSSIDEANGFTPPDWFGEDVTENPNYHNSVMSRMKV